ncbi:MAG: glycosyltransferase [Candidatus Helarchaeota archaeon]
MIGGSPLRIINISRMLSKYYDVKIASVDQTRDIHMETGYFKNKNIEIFQKKVKKDLSWIPYYISRLFNFHELFYPPQMKNHLLSVLDESDGIQIESIRLASLVRKKIHEVILDLNDVEWELLEMYLNSIDRFSFRKIFFYWWWFIGKKYEKKILKKVAHVIVCSNRDKEKIIKEIPEIESKISVIPNCIDLNEYFYEDNEQTEFLKKKYQDKKVILFTGSGDYHPNIDAIKFINNKIAPNFINTSVFLIVGKNPPKLINKKPNVFLIGFVKSVLPYLQIADVCIAPIKFGSGTRLKILEYMAMRKPVISTAKGAEGIEYVNNENIIIEDNENSFIDKIKFLLRNKKLCLEMGKNARKLIQQKYDWRIYESKMNEIYKKYF